MAATWTMGRQRAASSSDNDRWTTVLPRLQKLGARVLTEVLDLISTEQMTELTAFKVTDRIVRDARTKIDERWSTFRVQRCGMFSSEHTLEALVVCSDFWEDRFSRPKFSEKNSARVDDTAPRERKQ